MSNKAVPNACVTDGMDFMKKMWGGLPLPGVMSPTTDLDELDKRISDLKSVEQWLHVNISMLKASIQGLEIQRGTLATLNSFAANFGRSGLAGAAAAPASTQEDKPSAASAQASVDPANAEASKAMVANATAWWGLLQEQFNQVALAAVSSSAPKPKPAQAKTPPTKPAASAATRKKASASKKSSTGPV